MQGNLNSHVSVTITEWYSHWGIFSVSNKVKYTLNPHYPPIPILGIYPRDVKTYIHKNTYMQMFIASVFTTAKKPETSQMPAHN